MISQYEENRGSRRDLPRWPVNAGQQALEEEDVLVRKITSARLLKISLGFHNFSRRLGMLHQIISVIYVL